MHIIKRIIYILITLAILIKLIFISSYLLYYTSYHINNTDKINININKKSIDNFYKWKSRSEFLFQIIIALLIIIIFNPFYNNLRFINGEISTLLFVFAILLIITANWNEFIINFME
jgi:predicted ABC-type exoprotein transport system permease subunit